ncbi:MAG: CPBP family intramembrane metalloprotease [Clostridia bacterium]|nr:CPBP family intramembrane metalloprotease [Clostridia bacterium]
MPEENNINQQYNNDASEAETSGAEPLEQKTEIEQDRPIPQYVTYIPYGFSPETYEERKKIKRAANIIGASFLVMTAFILVLNFVSVFLISFLSPVFNMNISLEEPAVLHTLQIILSLSAFTVPFIICFKIGGERISDLISFSKPEKELILPFFLFGISFCFFANIAVSYAGSIFERFGIEYDVDFGDNPKGIFGFLLVLISTVIVPALVEEFACRGLILGLLRKFGDSFAIITSAILFGLMHGNFEQMPFAFLVGLVLGFITVKSGSVLIAMAVHAFNNFISVVFNSLLEGLTTVQQNILYTVFLTLCLLGGLAALLLKSGSSAELFKLNPPETKATEGKKYKWFFCSVVIIIFIAYCLIESLAFFVI